MDVMLTAAKAKLRSLLRGRCAAGKRVADVAPKLAACVEPFGVNLVEGVMSHQMKQFIIDGNKVGQQQLLATQAAAAK